MVGEITETQISDNAIKSPHISAGAIVAGKIDAGAVGANEIAANAVTSGKILAGAILADHIAVGEISADHLAANSVTTRSMAAGSINGDRITAGTLRVHSAEIENAAINSLKIAGAAVTVPVTSTGGMFSSITGDIPIVVNRSGTITWHFGKQRVNRCVMMLDEPGIVYVTCIAPQGWGRGHKGQAAFLQLEVRDSAGNALFARDGGDTVVTTFVTAVSMYCEAGPVIAEAWYYTRYAEDISRIEKSDMFMIGAKR
jgi:hypothetical protein